MKRFPIVIKPIDGKHVMNVNRQELQTYIDSIEGKRELIIGTSTEARTLLQNRYMHLIFGKIADYVGEPLEKIKCMFKIDIGMYDVFEYNGKQQLIYHETRSLSKKDFGELTEHLIAYAANLGINVPSPEEFYTMLDNSKKEIDFEKLY